MLVRNICRLSNVFYGLMFYSGRTQQPDGCCVVCMFFPLADESMPLGCMNAVNGHISLSIIFIKKNACHKPLHAMPVPYWETVSFTPTRLRLMSSLTFTYHVYVMDGDPRHIMHTIWSWGLLQSSSVLCQVVLAWA